MKEFDNTSIEKLAKSEVDDFFTYTGFIRPYISENDKTPVWDGNLFVYSEKRKMNNETLRFKIPLQLKGEEIVAAEFSRKTYYSISKSDLELYRNDGGVLFFKVLIIGRKRKIYYNFLTKHRLDEYLKSLRGKSRSVKLLPLEEDDFIVFLQEANAFNLQQNKTSITPMELKDKVFQIRCDAPKLKDENDYAFIIRNQNQLIVKVDGIEGEFYLDCENMPLRTPVTENREISVNGIVFYKTVIRVYEPNNVQKLIIGKSLTITFIQEQESVNINISITLRADNFEELLHELRFIDALGRNHSISMDKATLSLQGLDYDSDQYKHWRNSLKLWEDANTLFNILHVYEKLDIYSMEDEDYSNLYKLTQALLYNHTLITKMKHDHLERIKVGNLDIIMLVRMIGKKNCKLESLQNSMAIVVKHENGNEYRLPILSKILREEPLQSNIDFDNMLDEYINFYPDNSSLMEIANEDVLILLVNYDKKRLPLLLSKADELCSWLFSKSDNAIHFLNKMQIFHRQNESISYADKERLYTISEEDTSETNRWAACVLLGEYERAGRYWKKMTADEKIKYVRYPIFNLVPDNLKQTYLSEVSALNETFATDDNIDKEAC